MHDFEVLKRPLITEKGTMLQAQNKYLFEVDRRANKIQVKQAVERAFKGVKVTAVNIITVPGKPRRLRLQRGHTPSWKKAIVTLREGDRIEVFEGV
jgi:large subunit ribosomal protein L23